MEVVNVSWWNLARETFHYFHFLLNLISQCLYWILLLIYFTCARSFPYKIWILVSHVTLLFEFLNQFWIWNDPKWQKSRQYKHERELLAKVQERTLEWMSKWIILTRLQWVHQHQCWQTYPVWWQYRQCTMQEIYCRLQVTSHPWS